MPLSSENFYDFCYDVKNMCAGLAHKTHQDQENLASGRRFDFILKLDSSEQTLAEVIYQIFKPATKEVNEKYFIVVSFNVSSVEESHPILTPEGRQIAYSQIFDKLRTSVLNESGRFKTRLGSVSESTGKTIDEIKAIIDSKIEELRSEFRDQVTYSGKNRAVLQLAKLYEELRDHDKLEKLVNDHSPSVRALRG